MGYGLIYKKDLAVIEQGIVPTTRGIEFALQLNDLHKYIVKLIKKYKPDHVAFEDVFFIKNKKTALDVASVRGIVLLAASQQNTHIVKYTPLQVKQAVTGYGRAEKQQVQKMVTYILKLEEIPKPDDVADALAVAICCANSL